MKQLTAMSAEEFMLFNELLCDSFGICFPENNKTTLENRIRQRVLNLGLTTFMDYYIHLEYNIETEKNILATLITNNETYFFRETYQFEAMLEHGADMIKSSPVSPGAVRFLCAGCSSGEEPYTLNIFLKENQFRFWGSALSIDAFDLDPERVAMARKAQYGPMSLRALDENQSARYFKQLAPNQHELKPMYRDNVSFAEGNITQLATFRKFLPYDVVFCRNVLIYFSEKSLRTAIDNFAQVLKPGGLLFLGHSESIIGLTKRFETVKLGNSIAYQRIGP